MLRTFWAHVFMLRYFWKVWFGSFDSTFDYWFCDSYMIDLFKILQIYFVKILVRKIQLSKLYWTYLIGFALIKTFNRITLNERFISNFFSSNILLKLICKDIDWKRFNQTNLAWVDSIEFDLNSKLRLVNIWFNWILIVSCSTFGWTIISVWEDCSSYLKTCFSKNIYSIEEFLF